MYFESRKGRKKGLPWFDPRTDWEKSSDEYFETLDELAQQLDDVDSELDFNTALDPCDFDSGYEYVYGRIKELKEYINQGEMSDELDVVDTDGAKDSLRDIYEELLDLYDSALLYDDYCGPDHDEEDDSDDVYDLDDDWDDDDDDWDDDDDDWDDDDDGDY